MNKYVLEIIKDFEIGEKAKGVRSMLSFLVEDEQDYAKFLAYIVSENCSVFVALCKLQEDKQEQNRMSKAEFLEMFKVSPIEALEKLFQHRVLNWHYKRLVKQGITPEYIFEQHEKYPMDVMMKLCG